MVDMKNSKIYLKLRQKEVSPLLEMGSGCLISRPRLPKLQAGHIWHPWALKFWSDIWSSSSNFEISNIEAVCRLLLLVDKFLKSGGVTLAKEVRLLGKSLDLPPPAKYRLNCILARTEKDSQEVLNG